MATKCKLCGSEKTTFFGSSLDRISEHYPWYRYDTYRCRWCQSLFVSGGDPEHDKSIYGRLNTYHVERQHYVGHDTYEERYQHDCDVAKMRLRKIHEYMTTPPRSIIDVGCSNGALVNTSEDVGMFACGTDASRYIVDIARLHREKIGRSTGNIFMHDIERDPIEYPYIGLFDIVQCNDVLEHCQNPLEAVLNMRYLLAAGGHLFIDTPDGMSEELLRIGLSYKHVRPIEHKFLFSELSLSIMAEKTGMVIRDIYRPIAGKIVAVLCKA